MKKKLNRNEKGKINEKLVLGLIRSLKLPWISSTRLATLQEDRQGGDVIIDDIWGKRMFLQVKTGHSDARKFRKKRRDLNLPYIVVVTVDYEKFPRKENLRRLKQMFTWKPND